MNAPASTTITPIRVADLLADGDRMPVYVHVIDHPDGCVLVDTGTTELHPAVADMDPRLLPLNRFCVVLGPICLEGLVGYASAPMDPGTAAAWRDLYIGTVGAGASLTGLTFVAIALDPHQIERTPLLRLRAANAVWCFVTVMFIGLAVLTPRPFTSVASVAVGVGGISGAVLLSVRTIRQRIFLQPHPGATVFRAAGNILGFLLAGVGGLSLIDVEQGWVFATLAAACVIMLSSGIFASWLLVLQIGVPSSEKS